jgi:N-terminal domain of (some) glycogen debranching enzymes/Amylo-alpha-1,6-glucosidase
MEQPYLHDLSVVLAAPQQCWSSRDGEIVESAIQGVYCADVRIAHTVILGAAGVTNEAIGTVEPGGGRARYDTVWRTPEFGSDPAIVCRRERRLTGDGLRERIVVRSSAPDVRTFPVLLLVRPDSTPMSAVRASVSAGDRPIATAHDDGSYTWLFGHAGEACFLAPGAIVQQWDGNVHAQWDVVVPAGGEASVEWRLVASEPSFPFVHSPGAVRDVMGTEPLDLLVQTASRDLAALRMTDRDEPDHTFYAAGAPWFLTLFGRDSILSARLSLTWAPDVALSTLKALAARQGTVTDPATAEQPGKIPHEVRGEPLRLYGSGRHAGGEDIWLPPVYYGTIDATCLWIMLLGDLDEAGLAHDDLTTLVPHLRGALGWLRDHSDADGDGFLEYVDTGDGLSNQGWKDSGDSIRWADGSLATSPIALCEVQGYAHEAALVGARLLERLGDADEAAAWRTWAADLAERFRAQFWVRDELGAYPAIALDAEKRPVTGVASNMGHLLGTGILSAAEERVVVDRLMHPTLRSGFGIRTLSTDNHGYWPLGYHVGSIWTHDNGVILSGMLRSGFAAEAKVLAAELLRAATAYDYRLPELYAGYGADETYSPLPFPAACHPQAWAAATAAVIEQALRG